jgi:hypothetical protein
VQATHENLVKAEQQALEEVPHKVVAQLEETKLKLHQALSNGITATSSSPLISRCSM